MIRRAGGFGCLLALVLGGCEGAPPADGGPRPLAELPYWTLQEDLRIGHEGESAYALMGVRDLAVSARGEIAVLSSLERQVRLFDADGRFLRYLGGAGQGPGEIRDREYRVGAIADTFWIGEQSWMHTFDADGRPLDSRPLQLEPDLGSPFIPREMIRMHGGYHAVVMFPRRATAETPPGRLLVLSPEGRETLVLDHPVPEPPQAYLSRQGRYGVESVPVASGFRPSPLPAVHPGGRFLVRVDEARPVAPGPHRVHREVLAPSGELLRSTTLELPARPVSREEADRRLRREAVRIGAFFGGEEAAFERFRREVPVPDFFLEVHAVHVTDEGGLWLEPQGEAGQPWLVLDPDLVPRARVEPPSGVTLRRVGEGAAWGVARDSLGVPAVVRFRVMRM